MRASLALMLALLSGCSTTLVHRPAPAVSAFDFSPPPNPERCLALDAAQQEYGTWALGAAGVGVAAGAGGALNEAYKGSPVATNILTPLAVAAGIVAPMLIFRREESIRQFVEAGCGSPPSPLPLPAAR